MRQLVMVGVDPGYRDVSVLEWATEWATATDQEMLVVSGFEVGQSEVPPDFHDELLAEARQLIETKLDFVEQGKHPNTRTRIIEGNPTEVLVETTGSEDPSLVALGSRGEGGYDQLAVGGVAHRVASELSRPIAIVRHMGGPMKNGTIVVGFEASKSDSEDESDMAETKALEWAIHAASQTGSRVLALCAGEHAESTERRVRRAVEAVADPGVEVEVVASDGKLVTALCAMGDDRDASMIVIGSKGAGGLLDLMSGKVAAQLIEKSDRPIILIHQQ